MMVPKESFYDKRSRNLVPLKRSVEGSNNCLGVGMGVSIWSDKIVRGRLKDLLKVCRWGATYMGEEQKQTLWRTNLRWRVVDSR